MTELSVTGGDWEVRNQPEAFPEDLAYTDEICRAIAEEMVTSGVASMPLLDRATGTICGRISAHELLVGRRRAVQRESDRNGSVATLSNSAACAQMARFRVSHLPPARQRLSFRSVSSLSPEISSSSRLRESCLQRRLS
jgi:hypothetical protein